MVSKVEMEKDYRGLLRYRWIVYASITSVYFLAYFHRVAPAVMGQVLMKEWSLTGTALGIMSSLYFLLYAAVQVPCGILTDLVGPRKLLMLSAASMAGGSLLSYMAPTFAILCIGRALIGVGAGLTYVPIGKIVRYWFRRREFATMIGLNTSIGNMGAIIATAPLMRLITSVGWRNVFLYVSVLTAPLIVINMKFVENSPEQKGFPPIEPDEVNLTENSSVRSRIAQSISV